MSEPSPKLDHDPLIVALANAVTELNTDSTKALRRWTRDRTVVDQINRLAKEGNLNDKPVIEIEFEPRLVGPDGIEHPDRWRIQFNHPVPTRNPVKVWLGDFPPDQARAALPELVSYLEKWQSARAKKLRPIEVEVKPITVTVAVQRYAVSRPTLRREVAKGALRDLRRPGSATNSLLLLDENQIASRWPTKS